MQHFIAMILQSYGQFFSLKMWLSIFENPTNWGLVATLVVMEGMLSADNAIVLAVQVNHLPKKQRKKALIYGIWGAYLLRFIAIGLGTTLVKFSIIKIIGGLYLLRMSFLFFKQKFFSKNNEDDDSFQPRDVTGLAKYIGTFWATVFIIEMLDATFSVDSILAAFGVSEVVGILFLGGALGILMMRGVASIFTILMEKVPELEVTAYVLIGFIGLKMLLMLARINITATMFLVFLVLSFLVTFVVHFLKRKPSNQVEQSQNN